MPLPDLADLVGHRFNDVDGHGMTHRQWMAAVGAAVNAGIGGGAAAFVFEQDVPATVWSITHALGFFPAVTTVDTLGREFEGAVEFVDDQSLTVTFAVAVTGKAFLS